MDERHEGRAHSDRFAQCAVHGDGHMQRGCGRGGARSGRRTRSI